MIVSKKTSKMEKDIFCQYDSKNTVYQTLLQNSDGGSPFSIIKRTIGPSGRIPTHSNPWGQAIYVLSGSATLFERKDHRDSQLISPDMIVYIPPDVFHEIVNHSLMTPCVFLNIMHSDKAGG